jgi:hypothetical protein
MGFDVSIDERIARWRDANTCPGEPIGLDYECMLEDIEQIQLPTEKTPIPTAVILGEIDLEFLEPVLQGFYQKRSHYPPIAMFRGVMLKRKKKHSWRGLKRYLTAYPNEARQLGFIDEDGRIKIPSYEQFRTFAQVRVDWDQIRDAIVIELQNIGKENGIDVGTQTVEDATMFETIMNDFDGKYNGHYKKKGLKEDIITCRTTGLPLVNKTIGGTECEGYELIRQLDHLQELGIYVRDHWVDGTYATLENIAISHMLLGTTLHYQVQEDWVIREDGKPERIKKIYQKLWKDPEFRPEANLNEMMLFLATKGRRIVEQGRDLQKIALSKGIWNGGKRSKRGRPTKIEKAVQKQFIESERIINKGLRLLEPVGAYFRNIVMEKAKENPEWMEKDKGKRQLAESINNHLKNNLGLQDDLRVKGLKNVHIHNTKGCVFLLLIGVHKMRNGAKKDFASLVGIE